MNLIEIDKDVELPPDFINFVHRNYERIEEIERKVEEFKTSWKSSPNFKHLFSLRYQKVFDSVDSCFSEGDIKKVISARIKPRLSLSQLGDSSDSDNGRVEFVEQLQLVLGDPDVEDEYYNIITKKYPLVHLDRCSNSSQKDGDDKSVSAPRRVSEAEMCFYIKGMHVSMAERNHYARHDNTNIPVGIGNQFRTSKTAKICNASKKRRRFARDGKIETRNLNVEVKSYDLNVPLNHYWLILSAVNPSTTSLIRIDTPGWGWSKVNCQRRWCRWRRIDLSSSRQFFIWTTQA